MTYDTEDMSSSPMLQQDSLKAVIVVFSCNASAKSPRATSACWSRTPRLIDSGMSEEVNRFQGNIGISLSISL